jgi:hypothetical protein
VLQLEDKERQGVRVRPTQGVRRVGDPLDKPARRGVAGVDPAVAVVLSG